MNNNEINNYTVGCLVKYVGSIDKLCANVFEFEEICNYVRDRNVFTIDGIEKFEYDNIKISFETADGSSHSLYVELGEIEIL
jgi:coenzyme F420-reducing hydrogenase beta subunit